MSRSACLLALALLSPAAFAQAKAPQQTVKPPVAQAWIDIATYSGMMAMGMGGGPPGALGGLFGGGRNEASRFGNAQTGSPGRWLDVTLRGSHQARGRPVWPNPTDTRRVPEDASLVGEHAFSGQGVPEGFNFSIPAAQDIMPPLNLAQRDSGGATMVEWRALPTARAYFLAAMGSRGENELVIWSSSEVPETGTGLIDYQTNAAVDRWLGEKVLLAPSVTRCAVPKGAFGEGAMLRGIAFGSELNLAHPPRPADPKQPWEPEWATKIRVKSVTMALLGMDMGGAGRQTGRESPRETKPEEASRDEAKTITPGEVIRGIRGIFGR